MAAGKVAASLGPKEPVAHADRASDRALTPTVPRCSRDPGGCREATLPRSPLDTRRARQRRRLAPLDATLAIVERGIAYLASKHWMDGESCLICRNGDGDERRDT